MVRTGVESFHAMPTETVRAVEPIQLNFVGSKFACGIFSMGASKKPRVIKPHTVPSCGAME